MKWFNQAKSSLRKTKLTKFWQDLFFKQGKYKKEELDYITDVMNTKNIVRTLLTTLTIQFKP